VVVPYEEPPFVVVVQEFVTQAWVQKDQKVPFVIRRVEGFLHQHLNGKSVEVALVLLA